MEITKQGAIDRVVITHWCTAIRWQSFALVFLQTKTENERVSSCNDELRPASLWRRHTRLSYLLKEMSYCTNRRNRIQRTLSPRFTITTMMIMVGDDNESAAVWTYSLGGFWKRHAKERLRQALGVHFHASTTHVIVLPLRHVRRLTSHTRQPVAQNSLQFARDVFYTIALNHLTDLIFID